MVPADFETSARNANALPPVPPLKNLIRAHRTAGGHRDGSLREKVRIVIARLRGEDSVAELCRKERINENLYYRWSKDFLEAGKMRLADGWLAPYSRLTR